MKRGFLSVYPNRVFFLPSSLCSLFPPAFGFLFYLGPLLEGNILFTLEEINIE